FFFSSRRRHTRSKRDWSSDVCSSDLNAAGVSLLAREQTADGSDGQLVRVERARLQRRRQIFIARLGTRFQSNLWRRGVRERLSRSEERRVGKEWRCGWVSAVWKRCRA